MYAGQLFVLLLAASSTPAAAPAADARAAVDAIYRDLPREEFDYRKIRYAPILKRLLARETADANGEVGLIDAVPFCDCQDTAEDYAFTTSSRTTSATTAKVTVRLRNGTPSTYRLDMVRLPSGWAVADIRGPAHVGLVAWLHRNLPGGPARRH